jgi:hypothetical protein
MTVRHPGLFINRLPRYKHRYFSKVSHSTRSVYFLSIFALSCPFLKNLRAKNRQHNLWGLSIKDYRQCRKHFFKDINLLGLFCWPSSSPDTSEFLGPQMALTYRFDAISQGTKNSQFPGPNPPPTCPRSGYARIQNIVHRLYKP